MNPATPLGDNLHRIRRPPPYHCLPSRSLPLRLAWCTSRSHFLASRSRASGLPSMAASNTPLTSPHCNWRKARQQKACPPSVCLCQFVLTARLPVLVKLHHMTRQVFCFF